MFLNKHMGDFGKLWIVFAVLIFASPVQAKVYEDAEDGKTNGWSLEGSRPSDGRVKNVLDSARGSRVIRTRTTGTGAEFQFGGWIDDLGWNNSKQLTFNWSMSTASTSTTVQVVVSTTLGIRIMQYAANNTAPNLNTGNPAFIRVTYGIGSSSADGEWHDFSRDLNQDLQNVEPGNSVTSVHGMRVLGQVRIDDIALVRGSAPTVSDPTRASFVVEGDPDDLLVGNLFQFDGSASTFATVRGRKYRWNFGNGVKSRASNPIVSFTAAGRYNVRLTVIDGNDDRDTVVQRIVIREEVNAPEPGDVTDEQAGRLLAQATFGATAEDINTVKRLGIEAWVDDQLAMQSSLSQYAYAAQFSNNGTSKWRQEAWWKSVIEGDDQLRQRVAFALSEIFVISDVDSNVDDNHRAIANYYDLLLDNAFGSYRSLLEEVTLNPIMGMYLNMLQNIRGDFALGTRPDENFAREVLQLFSIGLFELNKNGTRKMRGGNPIPTYNQDVVKEYARAFTGWNYDGTSTVVDTSPDPEWKFLPMTPFQPDRYHDSGQKGFLGGVVSPSGTSIENDLRLALDSIANHPNVAPFISTQLIQRLVTSNPSSGYVKRVSRVFDKSSGNLRDVVKAIIMDEEARNPPSSIRNRYGKLREPLLRLSHFWRAFNVRAVSGTDYGVTRNYYSAPNPYNQNLGDALGQGVLQASSVFNFFHPDYVPDGFNIMMPESEIYSGRFILSATDFLNSATYGAVSNISYPNFNAQVRIAGNADRLIDNLNLLLLSNQMTRQLKAILTDHIDSLPSDTEGRLQRVRDAVTLIMASHEYLVQR